MIYFTDVWHDLLLVLGCGFVIFFHELGHFLAAKYCGVKVEQFAVGFGNAAFAWRKGIGFRSGTTAPEAERRAIEHLNIEQPSPSQINMAMEELGLGETEYRLNWLPLGGYVKMVGQDDLAPVGDSSDPRSYNNKPIRSRMLILSAGVIMNILLATFGFMIVYLLGFKTGPAEVGGVLNGSPASFAQRDDGTRRPLATGDRILSYDGKELHDFPKLAICVALGDEGRSIPVVVQHRDGKIETLHVTPTRAGEDPQDLVSMGVYPPLDLRGLDPNEVESEDTTDRDLYPADADAVKPGDEIVAIDGKPVGSADADNYWKLEQAIANSDGRPITLTLTNPAGPANSTVQITPHFQSMFGEQPLSLAGMTPRADVQGLVPKSPARGQIHPGDVIAGVVNVATGAHVDDPSPKALKELLSSAGDQEQSIVLTLENSQTRETKKTASIVPDLEVAPGRHGLGINLGYDEQSTTVAAVDPGSAAAKAGIQPSWRLVEMNGQKVSNWFQVCHIIADSSAGQDVAVEAIKPDGTKAAVTMTLSQAEIDAMKFMSYSSDLIEELHPRQELRQTSNPILAAQWGAEDTYDQVAQCYLTLRRMFGGSVSYKEAMGPIGIFRAGTAFAGRGTVWLIWFLAMISAQLAVVNFLPIPIADGGQFILLILEKIQGHPLSMNAQKAVQIVGLALILSVFLLVTYQDILRWLGKA